MAVDRNCCCPVISDRRFHFSSSTSWVPQFDPGSHLVALSCKQALVEGQLFFRACWTIHVPPIHLCGSLHAALYVFKLQPSLHGSFHHPQLPSHDTSVVGSTRSAHTILEHRFVNSHTIWHVARLFSQISVVVRHSLSSNLPFSQRLIFHSMPVSK